MNPNKRILLLPEYFQYGGGSYTFLLKIIKIFHNLNFDVVIIIENHKNDQSFREICFQYNIKIIVCPNRLNIFRKPFLSLVYEGFIYFKYVRDQKFDILVVSNISPYLNLAYFIFNRRIIYFMHSFPHSHLRLPFSFIKIFTKFLSKKKFVVAVSNITKISISKFMGFNKNYIKVIYNSFDDIYLQNRPDYNNQSILTLGLMNPIKNFDTWIKVVSHVSRRHAHCKFIWAGAHSTQIDYYRNLIKSMSLEPYAEILPYTSNILPLLSQSSIYFQPSLSESHGISVIEAMAAGLPCVVSNVDGLKESVQDGVTGFLSDPLNFQAFSKTIIYLIQNPNKKESIGFNGKRFVSHKFSSTNQQFLIQQMFFKVIYG